MGFLGSLISSGLDVLGSAASSAMSAHYNREAMRYQQRLNLETLEQSPSRMRKGLEDAGYNPLLAVDGGVSQANGVSALSPSVDFGRVGSSALQNRSISQEMKKRDIDIDIAKSESRTAAAEAKSAEAQAEADVIDASNQQFVNSAKNAALNGLEPLAASKAYHNLRQAFENETELKKYINNVWRQGVQDVLGGANQGASAFESMTRSAGNIKRGALLRKLLLKK